MWKQTNGIGVTLSDPAAAEPTFEAPAVGQEGASLTFQVTVVDIDGLQSTDTCAVNVNAVDIPSDDTPLPVPGDVYDDDDDGDHDGRYEEDDDDRDNRYDRRRRYYRERRYERHDDDDEDESVRWYRWYRLLRSYDRDDD